jgi:hypothetical protein
MTLSALNAASRAKLLATQPLRGEVRVIAEGELTGLQADFRTQSGQGGLKRFEAAHYRRASGERPVAGCSAQPVADSPDQRSDRCMMGGDILTGNVGDEFLVAISIGVEDQAVLALLPSGAEPQRAQEHAEFERHVEARQAVRRVEFRARDVVDAEAAFRDDLRNAVDANLAGVVNFKRAAGNEPTVEDRKHNRSKKRLIGLVEGAIDEDVEVVIRCGGAGRHRVRAACLWMTTRTALLIAAFVVFTGFVAGDLIRLTALPAVDFERLGEDFI